ncbi:hypothetical protein [Modestobacter sp. VKM Ac-2984]|uniref:hypothetical protein n=1 Tax=Modestobacter sp. VKM Ac-2984 TaxID=3004138 RepID=UPI0022AB3E4C|nr:hypothetical protein [Modestobacter sp. VKM Ac-2984]MCZ2817252.1 hypothetical protein [Modestobacter sp. VKM Ac-2984]
MTCPIDGKKLRNGVCLVCHYAAPDATMSTKRPLPGAGPSTGSGWRGRAGTGAGVPGGAPPAAGPPPSGRAGAGPRVPPISPVTPPPVTTTPPVGAAPGPGPSGPAPAASRPTRGRVVVTGTISDVSPERYDTVRLGVNNALSGTTVSLLTIFPRAVGIAFGVLLSIVSPRLGGATRGLSGLGGRRYGQDRPDSLRVPGTPFVLDGDDCTTFDCYLRGELRGGAVRLGDRVEVRGRIDPRSQVLEVGELVNARTGATTRGYVDPSARMTGVRTVVQLIVVIVLVLALLSMCRAL